MPRTSPRRALAPSLVVLCLLAPTASLAAESAVIQEILDGREMYIDQKRAEVKERARAPQQVLTRDSRGQIAFSSGAVGRLNRFSQIRLGSGCFLVDRGQILVSGRQSGCTRSARLSVRGTNYVLEVGENGDSDLAVLEGSVEVETLREGEATGAPPTTVNAGQRLRLSPQGVVLALLTLTPSEYTTILKGPLFQGFRLPLPAYGSLESYIRANMPSVTLPATPTPPVSLPFRLPRFF